MVASRRRLLDAGFAGPHVARPGDIIEFKSGLFGIEAPRNIAVFIRRWRRKGTPWIAAWTVEGRKEIKADHVTRRAFKARYQERIDDAAEAMARLKAFIEQHSAGTLVEEVEDDLAALEEELWEAVADEDRVWSEDGLAERLYGDDASSGQRKQVRAALDRCRKPGTGRFEVADKGDQWRPWMREEVATMRKAWQALDDLRETLITSEETEEGRVFQRNHDADLAGHDETLSWVKAAMVQFIEHDGVPSKSIAGLGGLGAVAAFGMDLHRKLGFLAYDWIATQPTTRSSDYIHFLLEAGLWSADDAVTSLMRRHVNREPFFEFVPDPAAEGAADELPRPDAESLGDDRVDLRHLSCHTIDPPDAKDFDDAVGIEAIEGGTRLWVHIADVSHYVRPGSMLDRHAKARATSVYLPGRVLPMLPARISDDLCSLRSDGDRFAMSVALDVAPDGRILASAFHRSLIRVDENLSYGEALARAEAGGAPFAQLLALSEQMRTHRRGLAIETGEIRIAVDATGFEAEEKFSNPATRMIETFMVAANEAVARHLADNDLPLLYRCHPLPDRQKSERFSHQMDTVGLDVDIVLPGKQEGGGQSLLDRLKAEGGSLQLFGGGLVAGQTEEPEEEDQEEEAASEGFAALSEDEQEDWLHPFREAAGIIHSASDRDLAKVMTYKMLSCMGQAFYTPDNIGHYGLASTHYCHFTSPIRRYPDIVVHRNLAWLISGAEGEPPHPAPSLETLCDHCSDQERAAAALERRIKSSCLVLASIGVEAGRGLITGLTPNRMFLDVDGIDASVAGRDLPGGPYQVDEWESMLFLSELESPDRFRSEDVADIAASLDEETGMMLRVRARLGQRVNVALAGRDVAEGRTDARIVSW